MASLGLQPDPLRVTVAFVIRGFKHRGLRRFFESGDIRGLNPNHVKKIRRILARLNAATRITDLDAPGHRLHPLKGDRKGEWAIDVDRRWRITFTFDGHGCDAVNYEDYH
jgi:proteic killer suppression protein